MIMADMSCQPIHYKYEEHDIFFAVCAKFDALIIRCNPGHICADGGDQSKFDDALRQIEKKGVQVWPSPDVVEFMDAKDTLTKTKLPGFVPTRPGLFLVLLSASSNTKRLAT